MSNSMAINDFSNRFSQFVKEKRGYGIPSNLDTIRGEGYNNRSTMNLFPLKQAEESNGSIGRTIDLFPQFSGFNSSGKKRANPEVPGAQMTILYGGQVVVFDDLPTEKANEVMNLARGFESSLKTRKVETLASHVPISLSIPNAKPSVNKNSNQNPNPNPSPSQIQMAPNFGNHVVPSADVPMTRKASLHRFMEKRKDRLVEKVPLLTNALEGGPVKPLEPEAWLGLNSLPVFKSKQQQQYL